MAFQVIREEGKARVLIEPQLGVENRQELKQKVLYEELSEEKNVLLDFAGCGYVDTSGLGVVVAIDKGMRDGGRKLEIAHLNDDLLRRFEVHKLDLVLTILK